MMSYTLVVRNEGIEQEFPNGELGDFLQMDVNGFRWARGINHPPLVVVGDNPAIALKDGQNLVIDLSAPGSFDGELNADSILGALHELSRLSHVAAIEGGYPDATAMQPAIVADGNGNVWYRDWTGSIVQISSGPSRYIGKFRRSSGSLKDGKDLTIRGGGSAVGGITDDGKSLIFRNEGTYLVSLSALLQRSEGKLGSRVKMLATSRGKSVTVVDRNIVEFSANPSEISGKILIEIGAGQKMTFQVLTTSDASFAVDAEMDVTKL